MSVEISSRQYGFTELLKKQEDYRDLINYNDQCQDLIGGILDDIGHFDD